MSYKSTRRQWVKLWVNEWLDGTTRFELTPAQRLLWVDLLALAGRSRFPGFIYAGLGENSRRVGYPIGYLAGVLQMDEAATNNTLKLLKEKGHITLEESESERYIIGIVNWEKYQSEYLRQKVYRKVTTKTTSRLPVEGEVEEEEDVKNKTLVQHKPLNDSFELFWKVYPRHQAKKKAQSSWRSLSLTDQRSAYAGVLQWKKSGRWDDLKFVPLPTTYLNGRRWEDEVPTSGPPKENIERLPLSEQDKLDFYRANGVWPQ